MKILFLTAYYDRFIKTFESNTLNFSNNLSYKEHLSLLLDRFFGDVGSMFHYSKKMKIDCEIIIVNFYDIQKKWANENGIKFNENLWMQDIALAQIKKFKPDLLYLDSVFNFFGNFLSEAKPYIRKIIAWIACPIPSNLSLKNIDLVFSSIPGYVEQFLAKGMKSQYCLPAFDQRVIEVCNIGEEKNIPFSFIGGWTSVHSNRKKALKILSKKTPISIWGYGYNDEYFKINKLKYFLDKWHVLRSYKGEAWGLDMYEKLGKSIVTFNIHEKLLHGYVGNNRMVEATGMGALLLNDKGCNVYDLFSSDEIETYSSIDEAIEKVKYYIDHPIEAIEMGKKAQNRTLEFYNYTIFIENLIKCYSEI